MKLLSYRFQNHDRAALWVHEQAYDIAGLEPRLGPTMKDLLEDWESASAILRGLEQALVNGSLQANPLVLAPQDWLSPVPRPASCRDGYAFRQHVAAARMNRGVPMIEEFDYQPIFYFTNHQAVGGPGPVHCMPDHFRQLDFELEVAVVVGRRGRNVPASQADALIAGYTIMNDWSARTLQMEEMLLSLGPAKGKDFATTLGPFLVTPDELEPWRCPAKPGHTGASFALEMVARLNGQEISRGNMGDMDWTFAEILERCAYGTDLHPGDVIGSGTVGTGCFLELNGTGRRLDPEGYQPRWLQAGDVMELEITGLGTLTNTVVADTSDFSILALKKNAS
jgi:fumarylacetoacetate (FAA) hydrolase